MPRNKTGGKKSRKGGNRTQKFNQKQPIQYADKLTQTYGKVIKKIGGSYVQLRCQDGKERQGYITGKMRKRVWLNCDDIVLVTLKTFGDDKRCTIELKYTKENISTLISKGEIDFDQKKTDSVIFDDETKLKDNDNYDEIINPSEDFDNLEDIDNIDNIDNLDNEEYLDYTHYSKEYDHNGNEIDKNIKKQINFL